MFVVFGPVANIRLWTSSFVFTLQKGATDTQETAERTNKHASLAWLGAATASD
jgi:hypothetical protein